jgi:hypothetical protein
VHSALLSFLQRLDATFRLSCCIDLTLNQS